MLLLLLFINIVTLSGPNSKNQLDCILRQRGINILHQNIRNLLSSFTNICKLINTHRNIKILTLSETHICNEKNIYKLFKIPGFKLINKYHKEGRGGGVAIYVKESKKIEKRFGLDSSHLENIVIQNFYQNK